MSQESLPEREFDQAEAYPLLEQIVRDTADGLPDFPGFGRRRYMNEEDCSQIGSQYEGWVSIEIRYVFSAEDSVTDLVRVEYTNLLRQMWTESGYDLHRDDGNGDGPGSMEARRPDGVNLWWTVAGDEGGVSLTLQSGCVQSTPGFEKPDYIAPAGGVPLEEDLAADRMKPSPEPSADAIAPFEGTQPAAPAGTVSWSGQLEKLDSRETDDGPL
ncbi:hypothetical protein [Glycomyces salinus]|uniref:hypothetical protein n=1 Tax=Glycomyces salinus TaxID=980294 RepID=UPI0018EB9A82|nr:hypothetical protein [Glycomyces salinus]